MGFTPRSLADLLMISSFKRGISKLMKEFKYLIGLYLDYSHLLIRASKKMKFYVLNGDFL